MLESPTFHFSLDPKLAEYCEKYPTKIENGENLTPEHFLPTRVKAEDVGYDMRCSMPGGLTIHPFEYQLIPLGVRALAPENWWLFLPPRSGTYIKRHINSLYGVIDPNYENYIGFACQFLPEGYHLKKKDEEAREPLRIEFGDRIAQVIPMPRYTMQIGSVLSKDEFEQKCKERNWSRGLTGFNGSGSR